MAEPLLQVRSLRLDIEDHEQSRSVLLDVDFDVLPQRGDGPGGGERIGQDDDGPGDHASAAAGGARRPRAGSSSAGRTCWR